MFTASWSDPILVYFSMREMIDQENHDFFSEIKGFCQVEIHAVNATGEQVTFL